ncbi:hypothetical protein EV360DRAFT_77648 [Lentinula raphanica]|nr:hypothetical protein EV360DRAFT_77648 [Lentinula raphanica]
MSSQVPSNLREEDIIVSKSFTTGNVSFRSSDGVVFRIDQWRLDFVSNYGFPVGISCLPDELVPLDEDSQTLDMLFTFMYSDRSIPNIGALPFDTLVKLLNAVDKYAMNAAIEICLCHLQRYAQTWPMRILMLAGRHNCGTLLAAVAPHLVNITPEVIETLGFSTKLCKKWVKYREKWSSTITASSKTLDGHYNRCIFWAMSIHPYLMSRIKSPVGPISCLVRGTNANGQKGLSEIYEIVMDKIEDELDRYGDKKRMCCKYELRAWFDRLANDLRSIEFPLD